jgi:hypothetical protein
MSDDAAKQRLMSVIVGEVSLVDHPANEEEFILMKAIEDSGKQGAEATRLLDELIAKSNLDNAAKQSLRKFIVDSVIPAPAPVNKTDIERTSDMTTQQTAVQQTNDLQQAVAKGFADFIAMIEKATKGDDEDKDGKGKKPMPPWMKEEMKKLAETLKGLVDDGDDGAVILQADGSAVAKGLKQFSKDRLQKLKDSLGTLAGMVKEIDSTGFAEFIAAFTPAPAVQANPGAQQVAKAEGTPTWVKEIQSGFADLTKSLTGLASRVEAVEKGAAVPKDLGGDGKNGGDKPVEKSKSFWHGVV